MSDSTWDSPKPSDWLGYFETKIQNRQNVHGGRLRRFRVLFNGRRCWPFIHESIFTHFKWSLNCIMLSCSTFVSSSVRSSRNIRLFTVNKRLDLEVLIFADKTILADEVRSPANFHPNPQRSWPSFLMSKIPIEYIRTFKRDYLANGDRQDTHCCCQHKDSSIKSLHWHIYISHWPILKVTVKVMHISIANFSQMVTDSAIIATANK